MGRDPSVCEKFLESLFHAIIRTANIDCRLIGADVYFVCPGLLSPSGLFWLFLNAFFPTTIRPVRAAKGSLDGDG